MIIKPEDTMGYTEDIFMEVDDFWTKKEVDECRAAKPEEYFEDWIPLKVKRLQIPVLGHDPITDIEALTLDCMEELDYRLYGFIMTALYKAIGKLFLSSQAM